MKAKIFGLFLFLLLSISYAFTIEEPLPAQYTVRSWNVSGDSLWSIAGQPWAYNDPTQWRLIYDANREKMPQADNPDLIRPGMILDIPSIQGETRSGMWRDGTAYTPLPQQSR